MAGNPEPFGYGPFGEPPPGTGRPDATPGPPPPFGQGPGPVEPFGAGGYPADGPTQYGSPFGPPGAPGPFPAAPGPFPQSGGSPPSFGGGRFAGPSGTPGFPDSGFPPGGPPPGNTVGFPIGGGSGFPGAGNSPSFALDESSIGRPPFVWLIFGLVLALTGLVAASVFGADVGVAFASWAVAGPLAIGLLAVFAINDTRQRARAVYTMPTWSRPLYWTVVVVAGTGILVSAGRIAQWAGQL